MRCVGLAFCLSLLNSQLEAFFAAMFSIYSSLAARLSAIERGVLLGCLDLAVDCGGPVMSLVGDVTIIDDVRSL